MTDQLKPLLREVHSLYCIFCNLQGLSVPYFRGSCVQIAEEPVLHVWWKM